MEEKKESTKSKMVYTPEVKKDKVLAYLKEKYNEEFVPKFMSESGWGQGHDEIWFYPKNGTEEEMFVVWGTILDDGSYAMRDGYFGIIIKDEYEAVMTEFVKEIYPDFKLYTSFGSESPCPDRLNKTTTIGEIYNKEEYFASDTIIFVKQNIAERIDTSNSLRKIAQKMKEYRLVGEVTIHEELQGLLSGMIMVKEDICPTRHNRKRL